MRKPGFLRTLEAAATLLFLEVKDARVLDSLASDHRMVVVELVLP